MNGFRQAVADNITIGGLLYGMPVAQFVHLLDEKLPVEGIGMVEIDVASFLGRHACSIIIVGVERHHSHKMRRKRFYNFLYNSGLAGARSTGNTNNSNLV